MLVIARGYNLVQVWLLDAFDPTSKNVTVNHCQLENLHVQGQVREPGV